MYSTQIILLMHLLYFLKFCPWFSIIGAYYIICQNLSNLASFYKMTDDCAPKYHTFYLNTTFDINFKIQVLYPFNQFFYYYYYNYMISCNLLFAFITPFESRPTSSDVRLLSLPLCIVGFADYFSWSNSLNPANINKSPKVDFFFVFKQRNNRVFVYSGA